MTNNTDTNRDDPTSEELSRKLDDLGIDVEEPETDSADDSDGDAKPPLFRGGAAAKIGRSLGRFLVWFLLIPLRITRGIAWGLGGKFPGRKKVYVGMIKAGYKGLYKKTSAQVIAETIYGDGEAVPRPAAIDDETGNLETSNGEEWTVESGIQPRFIGDVPVVTGVADQHETVDHVGARIAEAVDYSSRRHQPVKRTQGGTKPADPSAAMQNGGGQPQAATDGGGSILSQSMSFDDIWVDASNPDESNDGWIISMEKAYALHWDQAGSEEMENQETRGILAAQDPQRNNKRMLIIGAMILGAFALGLFGPALAQQIAGGASGGLGGGISL
jgi:hypothetical protein